MAKSARARSNPARGNALQQPNLGPVEQIPLGMLKAYPGNARTHDDRQIAKIIVVATGWTLLNPATPTFSDTPANSPFYSYIETAYAHGIISGYDDGTFRWPGTATRGQAAKIVYGAFIQAR